MKGMERLAVIRHVSETNNEWKHKELFRILHKEDIWIAAYENIKSNKGALTPGSTNETLDQMSLTRLKRLREKVINQSYIFKPVREIEIPKPDGRKRPLGLPTANDKIVQDVIRMILEAIYEPCFSKQSFGFRHGLGTHDAFEHVESKFRWIDWVIEGDIEGAYPTIDHNRLCEILSKKVDDCRFLHLIRKSLKCGILREKQFTRSNLGVPQGSIVSPILANIYYHEMDLWVDKKIEMLNQPQTTQRSKKYKHLAYRIGKITKEIQNLDKRSEEYKTLLKELKEYKRERQKTPSLENKSTQIEYVRYADDWMIGVRGDKTLANQIKTEIGEFLNVQLNQKLHSEKTKITNIRAGKAKFLGYEIYLPKGRNISAYSAAGTRTTRRTNPMLRFDIPMDSVLRKMEERGYLGRSEKGYFPTSKKSYTTLQDIVIVEHFRKVWKGIENYYSGCTNLKKLQYIHYLLRMSCAMTLAHRHRSSSSKMFAKFGKNLTTRKGNRIVSLPVRQDWSLKNRKWLNKKKFIDPFKIYANRVTRSSLNKKCRICQTLDNIEMHHVRHVRKNGIRYGGFLKEMSLLNSKQLPLCRKCHMKVHEGLYDGIKLTNQTEA
jgi:group II intron reverse transcriptase/maturase